MKGGAIMQRFKVRDYYLDLWGYVPGSSLIVTMDDIIRYSQEWDVPVPVLLAEVDLVD